MYEFTGNLKYKKAFELSQFESHMRFSVERCHALWSSRGVTSALCSPEVGGGGGAAGGFREGVCPFCHSPSGFHQELAGLFFPRMQLPSSLFLFCLHSSSLKETLVFH